MTLTATPELKTKLRKTKTLPSKIKAIIYAGNKSGPALAVQFNADVQTYGLWEALLYAEGYERDGFYVPGTAQTALDACQ
jgi:hypothetical protein